MGEATAANTGKEQVPDADQIVERLQREERERRFVRKDPDEAADEQVEETFPASDPPSNY